MTDTAPDTTAGSSPRPEAQRRVLTVLVSGQVLSGAGLAAGITVGALLAQDMLGSTDLAGLPSALFTAGSALAAVAIGRISQARGRRPGLAAGYLTGAVGSAGVIAAAVADSAVLLFIALFVYGAGTATNLQARYAGADLAAPAHRARAVSTVLVATTLGGVVGPNLAAPTGRLADSLGIPTLAGPFLLSGTAYALAALVLAVWLRPDPLLLARSLDLRQRTEATEVTTRGPGLMPGALTMILTQLVMVAVMTMTPVHMHDHGHGTAASGLVIAIHVGAMYLPSPLTGWLVDRYGPTLIAAASGLTLLGAGITAAVAPADSVALLAVALALLGLGWNLGLVSGTAMITDAVPLATRARTQGMVDVSIAIAGATGGLASGLVVSAAGYPLLALTGGILALAVLPAIAATASSR
ncbi:putative metabolite transport protein [Streptomyces lincolnensis]|uniref:Putative metabolite transport protein n=1 Tax=Streptomyces lincolnensis TaxID=1915 RepID=A0A1B1M3Q5_STRLN|nr:MFS transporter [Streptomyces lincolnensis]ANS63280.1 putative metabolite transport protein [Streptomyces lincolnensis]AXG52202.1 putative metabolite transport protein [Streptomyces lincolnensis]QMV05177.1 MFS transporter [Streptomyces lincolnensis]